MENRLDVQFPLRLPRELREAIKLSAKKNARTMNGEILLRLRQVYSPDENEKADAQRA